MLKENARFRIKPDHLEFWSEKLTRSELFRRMKKYGLERSYSWPYSLKLGVDFKMKNSFGKLILVRREYDYLTEERYERYGYQIPYEVEKT